MNKTTTLILAIACTLLLSSCVDKNTLTTDSAPAGFFHGVWNGISAPFSLIGIMFGADIGFYEPNNTGNWYNLGFLIGISALMGSSVTTSKK